MELVSRDYLRIELSVLHIVHSIKTNSRREFAAKLPLTIILTCLRQADLHGESHCLGDFACSQES